MDRQTVYPGQIPLETDLLNTNRNVLTAIGALVQDIFGTNTVFTGLSVVPTVPASMSVNVNPGRCFSLQNLDNTPYSSLPANQTLQIMKQGILSTAQTFAMTAPVTAGYSVNYLISAAFLETDTGATVLPYYNAAQPSVAWSGPGGNGATNTTVRQDTVSLTLTAGVPATTGTQTTPATPAGTSALYVVTVAYGQATITAANISAVNGAQILPGSLMGMVQQSLSTSAMDTGAANAYAATFTPAIQTLSNNMTLVFEAKNSNTGASTFSPNGLTVYPILGGDHNALTGGEIVAGGKYEVIWKSSANAWILLGSTGGYGKTVTAPQFDNSNKAATTAFVQGAIGNIRPMTGYTASASIPIALAGSLIEFTGTTASQTLTLPTPVGNNGAAFYIANHATVGVTLATPSGVFADLNNPNPSSYAVPSFSTVLVISDGTNWVVMGGSGIASLVGNGYQKLPSGLIIQWGQVPCPANYTTNTNYAFNLPIAFPNAQLMIVGANYGANTNTSGTQFNNTSKSQGTVCWGASSAAAGGLNSSFISIGN